MVDKLTPTPNTKEEECADISPASIPFRTICTWDDGLKSLNVNINGDTAEFTSGEGFRYCKSNETFNSGQHRYEVNIEFINGQSPQVSVGICYVENQNLDCGTYYYNGAYMYCNYYPSFTKDFNNIHKKVPKKLESTGGNIAINFDIDNKQVSWEIDGVMHESCTLDLPKGKSFYIVVGMFKGKATFI